MKFVLPLPGALKNPFFLLEKHNRAICSTKNMEDARKIWKMLEEEERTRCRVNDDRLCVDETIGGEDAIGIVDLPPNRPR